MEDLFSNASGATASGSSPSWRPLADRARPKSIDEFFGQIEVLGRQSSIRRLFEEDRLPSLILWGPPGCGKTSFAQLVATKTRSQFLGISAIDSGAKELREQGQRAQSRLQQFGEKTILFVDEIHRLNKSQQDVLLPFVEKGFLTLIGATTENPSFELNPALLSRARVVVFKSLEESAVQQILEKGLKLLEAEQGSMDWSQISLLSASDLKKGLIQSSQGDARRALNLVENLVSYWIAQGKIPLNHDQVTEAISRPDWRYDKDRDQHHDTVSAFIKSIRGSDPHAALYYLARMLKGGEDPLFIARRLVVLASEDIGNADPRALQVALSIKEAIDFVGLPEARINLAQGVTYLATAPKSNRAYVGLQKATEALERTGNLEIPLHLKNPATRLMKDLGYGKDYDYAHDFRGGWVDQTYLPEELKGSQFYEPSARGYEKQISAYLEWINSQKQPKT